MENSSILSSIKRALGVPEEENAFDTELLMHINNDVLTLTQIGAIDVLGIVVDAETTWLAFGATEDAVADLQTHVYISVRLLFDPPSTSYVTESFRKTLDEATWRLQVKNDGVLV